MNGGFENFKITQKLHGKTTTNNKNYIILISILK
jgi:hypothetical protein